MERTFILMTVLASITAAACGDPGGVVASPATGSAAGGELVTLSIDPPLPDGAPAPEVRFGAARARSVRRLDAGHLEVVTPGGASGGTSIVVTAAGGAAAFGRFDFDPPADPRVRRIVGIGASITMGVQNETVGAHGQGHSFVAFLARQAGVDVPIPFVPDGVFPGIELTHFAPDGCARIGSPDQASAFQQLLDPDTHDVDLRRARLDPDLRPLNFAVGGEHLRDIISSPIDDPQLLFLENIIFGSFPEDAIDVFAPSPFGSQLEQLERIEGIDVVVSSDPLANDLDHVRFAADGSIVPGTITSIEEVREALDEFLGRLDATGAQVFIADVPYIDFAPFVGDDLEALGEPATSRGRATFRALIDEMNDALRAAAPRYPRVHVVSFKDDAGRIAEEGLRVAGRLLTTEPMHGLLSLDRTHFTDTGNAALANLFIREINAAVGSAIPEVDLDAVYAADPLSPDAIAAAGYACP